MITNVEAVPMPTHGVVVPLERIESDRSKQLDMLDDLAPKWSLFCEHRLRAMQQITVVLIREGGELKGQHLAALQAIHSEFCGGDSHAN